MSGDDSGQGSSSDFGATCTTLMKLEKLRGRINYLEWKFMMRNSLIIDNLWFSVVGYPPEDGTKPEIRKRLDQKALSKICLSVDKCCYSHLMKAETALQAWTILEKSYEDKGLNRRLSLLRSLCSVKLRDFPNMEAYINEVTSLAQQLANVEKPIDDEFLGAIMLQGLTPEYEPMIMALEHSGAMITSDLIKTKLLQTKRWTDGENAEDCLYTRQKSTSSYSGKGEVKQYAGTSQVNNRSEYKKKLWCWICKKKGHLKKDCLSKEAKLSNMSHKVSSVFNIKSDEYSWYIDSGATNTMTGKREWFDDLKIMTSEVCIANGEKLQCKGIGKITVLLETNGKHVEWSFNNVMYVPNLTVNLISVARLTQEGYRVLFTGNNCDLVLDNVVKLSAKRIGGSYRIDSIHKANSVSAMNLWHRRLGHLNFESLKYLRMSNNIDFQLEKTEICDVCMKGKQVRFSFPHKDKKVAEDKLDLVHTDLCGPLPQSLGGKRYLLTFLDDHTRKIFIYFLAKKDEVCKYTKEFITLVENQCSKTLKILRSDNGTEYVNKDMTDFLKRKGIVHQLTVPYTPQQNGAAERLNRTLIEKVRCLLFNSNLDQKMWAEAAYTAVYLINRSPSSRLSGKIPEEMWSERKVSYKHLRIFGCEVHAHINAHKRKKLDSKSEKLLFVGYEDNVKGYRLLNPKTNKIIISRNVVFNEEVFPGRRKEKTEMSDTIPLFFLGSDYKRETLTEAERKLPMASIHQHTPSVEAEQVETPTIEVPCNNLEMPCCNVEEISTVSEPRYNLRSRVPKSMNCSALISFEPRTVKEALASDECTFWQQAMQEELDSFKLHGVWELLDKPQNKNIVKNKSH